MTDLKKNDPDARELIDLDVQFVSGVTQPATGHNFLLYKSQEANMSDEKTTPEVTPVPVAPSTESFWKDIQTRIAHAFGIQVADDKLTQATEALATIAKASGYAPVDDAGKGKHPNYPDWPYPNRGTGIPNTNSTKTASVNTSSFDTTVDQLPEVVQGQTAVNSSMAPVTEGQPVTKDWVEDFIKRIEKNALNKEALADAKEALNAAFVPAPKEEDMTADEVRDLVLKAVEPIVNAVDDLQQQVATQAEAVSKSNDTRYSLD
jgi:hypothetical protein